MILLGHVGLRSYIDVVKGNLGLLAAGILDLIDKGADGGNIPLPFGIHGNGIGHIALIGYIRCLESHTDRSVTDILPVYTVEKDKFTVAIVLGGHRIVKLEANLAHILGTGGVLQGMGFPFGAGFDIVIGSGVGLGYSNANGTVSHRSTAGSVFRGIPVRRQIIVDAVVSPILVTVLCFGSIVEVKIQIACITNETEIV